MPRCNVAQIILPLKLNLMTAISIFRAVSFDFNDGFNADGQSASPENGVSKPFIEVELHTALILLSNLQSPFPKNH
jgi:hypothetical protein